MKWLLVTTQHRTPEAMDSNVGDEFARIGVENLIRAVDLGAQFDLLNKEDEAAWEQPREFDRAVICGMPLFWSTTEQTEPDIWWWERMWRRWLASEPRKLMALGVGHVVMSDPVDAEKYVQGMNEAAERSWKITTREPIARSLPSFIEGICPSAWCLAGHVAERNIPLCNFMPGGGHFGHLTDEGMAWDETYAKQVSDVLIDLGFECVAHTQTEADYAANLGWPKDRVRLFKTADEYLDLYAKARLYVGNRIHGALVCASTRCPVMGMTHDSRLASIERLGGHGQRIDHNIVQNVLDWLSNPLPSVPEEPKFEPSNQFGAMMTLLQEFSRQ